MGSCPPIRPPSPSSPPRPYTGLPSLSLFGASLIHLFVVKAATQTGRDLVGGVLSAALTGGILVASCTRDGGVTRHPVR